MKNSDLNLVPFVSVTDMVRMVNRAGVDTFLKNLGQYIEEDFCRWPIFDKTPRTAAHSEAGVIELMPVSDGSQYAFKYVNGHPRNTRTGHQTVAAFGVLSDVRNGYPLLLSEMTLLTALRTAATSAIAARYLARPDSRIMAIIGNGAQSEFQALAFRAVTGITTLRLYDTDAEATTKCVKNLRQQGFDITVCSSAREAVSGADIITTVTADKQYATILTDDMVEPGVHINAVGGDCPGKTELEHAILLRARIFVEYPPQTREEGEIQQLPAGHPVIELAEVISGGVNARTAPDDITLFDSVGFATEDFSALRYVYTLLQQGGCHTMLDFIASPADPKDLFGLLDVAGKDVRA